MGDHAPRSGSFEPGTLVVGLREWQAALASVGRSELRPSLLAQRSLIWNMPEKSHDLTWHHWSLDCRRDIRR
jgi:hypothetical protein